MSFLLRAVSPYIYGTEAPRAPAPGTSSVARPDAPPASASSSLTARHLEVVDSPRFLEPRSLASQVPLIARSIGGALASLAVRPIAPNTQSRLVLQERLSTVDFYRLKPLFEKDYTELTFCMDLMIDVEVDAEPFKTQIAIPFVLGSGFSSHVVLAFYDRKLQTLEFFNSKGWTVKETPGVDARGRTCEGIMSSLAARFQPRFIIENQNDVQLDSFNCGIYVLDYIRRRAAGQSPKDITSYPPDLSRCTMLRSSFHIMLGRAPVEEAPLTADQVMVYDSSDDEGGQQATAESSSDAAELSRTLDGLPLPSSSAAALPTVEEELRKRFDALRME